MAKANLGTKRVCPETSKKFYDLEKDPIVSPYTGKEYPLSHFEGEANIVAPKPAADEKAPEKEKAKDASEDDDDDLILDDDGPEIISLDDAVDNDDDDDDDDDVPDIPDIPEIDDEDDDSESDDTFLEDDDEDDDLSDVIVGVEKDDDDS